MAANEFAEMLATFDRWIATQEAAGWGRKTKFEDCDPNARTGRRLAA